MKCNEEVLKVEQERNEKLFEVGNFLHESVPISNDEVWYDKVKNLHPDLSTSSYRCLVILVYGYLAKQGKKSRALFREGTLCLALFWLNKLPNAESHGFFEEAVEALVLLTAILSF